MRILIVTISSVMLLSFQSAKPQRTEPEAKHLIDSLYAQLLNGADFTTLVTLYSEDQGSVKNGGVYQNIAKGQFVPEFDYAVLNLKLNGISKPFKSKYGYNIVQLLSRQGEKCSARVIIITFKN